MGIEAELFHNTHTPTQLANTSILCSFLVCELSRFSDLRSERRRNPSELCVSVFFPFPEGEFLMLNCGILFNTCFGSSFFGEGGGGGFRVLF
jgi:hypothetical protein